MSHNKASEALDLNPVKTCLMLIGGYDCDSSIRQYPDLFVKGGARIRKTLCVDGRLSLKKDLKINGNIIMDCGDIVNANSMTIVSIKSKEPDNGVTIENITISNSSVTSNETITFCNNGDLVLKPTGNLVLDPSSLDFDIGKNKFSNVNAICASTEPPCHLELSAAPGMWIMINGGLGIDLNGRDIIDANVIEANILTSDGDLTIVPQGNVCIDSVMGKTIIKNELCLLGNITNAGGPLEINPFGDICLDSVMGKTIIKDDLCLVGNLTNTGSLNINPIGDICLDSQSGKTIIKDDLCIFGAFEISGSIDMGCANIGNVGHLFVSNIHGKSPITIHDDLELLNISSINNADSVNTNNLNTNNLNGAAIGDLSGVSNENIIAFDTTNSEFKPKSLSNGTNISITPGPNDLTINSTTSFTFHSGTISYREITWYFLDTGEGDNPTAIANPILQRWYGTRYTRTGYQTFASLHFNQSNTTGIVIGSAPGGLWTTNQSPFSPIRPTVQDSYRTGFYVTGFGTWNTDYAFTDPNNSGSHQHMEIFLGLSTLNPTFLFPTVTYRGRLAIRSTTDPIDDNDLLIIHGFTLGPFPSD